jgi:hypothetical protein
LQLRTAARVLLRFSDMEASGRAGSYDVYVNVPPGTAPQDHADRFAGRISLYGPPRAPRKFNFVLDVSRVRDTLAAGLDEPGHRLRITIVPVYDWSEPVTVGSVSLHLG